MVFIYILQLEQGKYYVGKTTNPTIRLTNHYESTGSAWTKKYKPVQIYQIIPDCDNYDEDKYTKIYMEKFGIGNVRGGSFCQIELNNEVTKLIKKGINSSNDNCYHCSQPGHFANSCPNTKISLSEAKQEAQDKVKQNTDKRINELQSNKKYNCEFCNKECPNDGFLQTHLNKYCKKKPVYNNTTYYEKVEKNYDCDFCNKECPNDDFLQTHLNKYCKKIPIYDNITSYEKVDNNYNCEFCNKECSNYNYLLTHLKDYCKIKPVYNNTKPVISNVKTTGKHIVKNIVEPMCARCKRDGHLKDKCFATTFENGKTINNTFYKSKFKR
jgi:hypothetical protein